MIQSSAQTKERQDRHDDHHKSNQIDNSVHGNLLALIRPVAALNVKRLRRAKVPMYDGH
jgi:hypothetical protein